MVLTNGHWSNANARGYKRGAHVKDPFQLRVNAYRVLLTRGRDGTAIFVPPVPEMDETFSYLVSAGVVSLESNRLRAHDCDDNSIVAPR